MGRFGGKGQNVAKAGQGGGSRDSIGAFHGVPASLTGGKPYKFATISIERL